MPPPLRFKKLPSPPKEVEIPARDQIKLKTSKPTRASEINEGEHVKIAEDKAKLKTISQGPEIPSEEVVPHNQQVQLKVDPLRINHYISKTLSMITPPLMSLYIPSLGKVYSQKGRYRS